MNRLQRLKNSRHKIIFLFAGIALTGFFLLRCLLLISAWPNLEHSFSNLLYVYGIGFLYDLTFTIYFSLFFSFLLLILPNRLLKSRFGKVSTLLLAFLLLYGLYFVLVAEWLFWEEFHTRFNFIAIDYLIYRHEVTRNIYESYPLFSLLGAIFIAALLTLYQIRKPIMRYISTFESPASRARFTAALTLAAILSYFLIGQPLKELTTNNYANELAGNGPYQFVAAFRNNKLDYRTFYALGDDRILSSKLQKMVFEKDSRPDNPAELYNIKRRITTTGPPRKLNIFLITVESLSGSYLTRFGKKRNITPFLDQWLKQGLLFNNFYATGTRTTRALEAITLSMPPTPGRSLVKRPEPTKLLSLGEVLKKNGYDTAFLYGGRGFFDNMNSFFSDHGYRCVDQTDFSKSEITFTNAWGVCDEDLYRKAISEADKDFKRGQPFFFHLMTTSNHRPYTYPEGKIDLPSGRNQSGAVKYTDYAFKRLISQARKRPWFGKTIFVVVADHCAHSSGKTGLPVAKYHIPFFLYAPAYIEPGENDKLSCQIDVAPTILGLLNLSYESDFFGHDILRPDFKPRALIANYIKLGLLKDEKLVVLSPQQKIDLQVKPYNKTTSIKPSNPLTTDCMAYYQGADHIICRNRGPKNREKDNETSPGRR